MRVSQTNYRRCVPTRSLLFIRFTLMRLFSIFAILEADFIDPDQPFKRFKFVSHRLLISTDIAVKLSLLSQFNPFS